MTQIERKEITSIIDGELVKRERKEKHLTFGNTDVP